MDKRLSNFRKIIIILMILLLLRAAYLQLFRGDYYLKLAEGNRISYRTINAPRGKIFGKITENGQTEHVLLATNKLSYNLYILPNEIPEELSVEELLEKVLQFCELEFEEPVENIEAKLNILLDNYNYNKQIGGHSSSIINPYSVLVKRNITSENMVLLKEYSDELPGVMVKEFPVRDYIYREFASHMLGYAAEINFQEISRLNKTGYNYRIGDNIGKTGVELFYERYLRGVNGMQQVEVNNRGHKVQVLGTKPPVPGNDLVLNIDFKLQQEIESILDKAIQYLRDEARKEQIVAPTGGSVIVMEADTGAILSMVSNPGYDLSAFGYGISSNRYRSLVENPLQPFLNRNLSAFPLGSVFKLVTGTAAIEELGIKADTEFVDQNGKFYIPGWSQPFRNWYHTGEGRIDFARAMARSNNIVFYELGYDLFREFGGAKLSEYAKEFGFGEKSGIDLLQESPGQIPDPEWKRHNLGEGWYPGDSVNLAIGQGGLLATPIQLINMVSAIANRGVIYKPRLVDKIVNHEGEVIKEIKPEILTELDISEDTFDILIEGMLETTSQSHGTAGYYFQNSPYQIAGKTGTAQTSVSDVNHGWFVGFAPVDDPEIVFTVFLERGYSSMNTLPVVAGILETYFDEEERFPDILGEDIYFTDSQLFDYFDEAFQLRDGRTF